MIHALLYDPDEKRLRQGGAELIDAWESATSSSIWVILEDESEDAESKLLTRRFGIHRLAVADALRDRHPPKIGAFRECDVHPSQGARRHVDVAGFRHDPTFHVPE